MCKCEVTLVSNDEFCQVSFGVVQLSGRGCQVRIEGSDSEPEYANHDADYAIFFTWARSILPGIDMSTGAFT